MSVLKSTFKWLAILISLSVVILGSTIFIAYQSLPSVDNINGCFTTTMFEVELCPTSGNYVKYSQLPKYLVGALIASEDSSFFFHKGFDWDEIEDSLQKSMDAGRWVRGGSTLTQQLAKNLYLNQDRTITRKVKEFYLADRIEKKLSKAQIIEKYFNVVGFGEKIYGIKKAANYYFAKSPSQLTPAECAYLVSLLPSPVKYSRTFRNQKDLSPFNKKRTQRILTLLRMQGKVSEQEFEHESARIDQGLWKPLSEIPTQEDSSSYSDVYFREKALPENYPTVEDLPPAEEEPAD